MRGKGRQTEKQKEAQNGGGKLGGNRRGGTVDQRERDRDRDRVRERQRQRQIEREIFGIHEKDKTVISFVPPL